MQVFDFNIHLPLRPQAGVNETVMDEFSCGPKELVQALNNYEKDLSTLAGANFMVFNTELFNQDPDQVKLFTDRAKEIVGKAMFSALIDFRAAHSRDYLDRAFEMGARAIKFHAYHQKISNDYFESILGICRMAAKKGMAIHIDCSYGTTKMWEHDNLKLVAYLAEQISNVPIVMLHSGGARVLEAMLIADERKNVWIETSFSLPYYKGSSIVQDLAYTYRKIGIDRVVYGTDYPYIGLQDSIDSHIEFFEQYRFSDSEIDQILYQNANRLYEDAQSAHS